MPATPSWWTSLFPSHSVALLSYNHLYLSLKPRAHCLGWFTFSLKPLLGPHQVPELSGLKESLALPTPEPFSPCSGLS